MVFFPTEIIINIYEFLNLQDLQIIKFVNQFSYDYSLKRSKQLFIEKYLPQNIQELFSNINYKEIHFLPFKESFVGDSNYIDSVKIEDLEEINESAPVFIGIDNIQRPYIALKMDIIIYNELINNLINLANTEVSVKENNEVINDSNKLMNNILTEKICTYRFVNVLFQRYPNDSAWCVGSCYNLVDFTEVYLQKKGILIYKSIFETLLNNNSLVHFAHHGMITNKSHSFCSLQDDCTCLFCETTSSDDEFDQFDEEDYKKIIYSIRLS